MENGTASSGGSGDRRRTTVSGPFPPFVDPSTIPSDEQDKLSDDTMRLPWTSPSAPTSPAAPTNPNPSNKPTGHKRSFSGNILSRLNFLRNTSEDGRPPTREKDREQPPQSPKSTKSTRNRKSIDDDDDSAASPVSPPNGESAMAAALKPSKTRKRKGSLRKTALLGGRRLGTEGRERKNSLLPWNPVGKTSMPVQQPVPHVSAAEDPAEDFVGPTFAQDDESTVSLRHQLRYENIEVNETSDSGWSESAAATSARLSLLTEHTAQTARKEAVDITSPLNLTSPVSYTSTTDDDDVLTFDSRTNSFDQQRDLSMKKPISSATSYFPSAASVSQNSLARRLSTKQSRSSPLSHNITTPSSYPDPEQHDYTETEYWGWVILFVTWLTFAVGMGSCLEIWSWAWDVGETPYAPPELEDDETLPIVGYYPALIVLTGVVAWIWITIAWLGMKYFRHAKIEV